MQAMRVDTELKTTSWATAPLILNLGFHWTQLDYNLPLFITIHNSERSSRICEFAWTIIAFRPNKRFRNEYHAQLRKKQKQFKV